MSSPDAGKHSLQIEQIEKGCPETVKKRSILTPLCNGPGWLLLPCGQFTDRELAR